MTQRFLYLFRQARLSLALSGLVAWTVLVTLHSCTKTTAGATQDSTYFGRLSFVIQNNSTFSYYYSALQITGLVDTLSSTGRYTVLLPNNDAFGGGYLAFAPAGQGDLNSFTLSVGKSALPAYIYYSILRGDHDLSTLPLGDNQELLTMQGGKAYISRYLSGTDTLTTVNGQSVISLNNRATNGSIDVVTGCLPNPQIYPTVMQVLQSDSNFAYFAAALKRTHLDTLLSGPGPFTVLTPSNFSFQIAGQSTGFNITSLNDVLTADTVRLRQLVSYHILPGRYFLNDFRRRQTSDTLSLVTLNGEMMKYLIQPGTGIFPETPGVPTFYGLGNLTNPNYGPASIYTPFKEAGNLSGAADVNLSDLPAANGVVHLLRGILIP